MVLEPAWQGLALRALIIVPVAILALRADITKLRAWRERVRHWRAKGTPPPPEYQRDNRLWHWRLAALAVCVGAFITMIALLPASVSSVWLFWLPYAVAMIAALTWGIFGQYVR